MTYKETLFFIGQSLTINHSNKNKIAIEKQLKENSVDWDAVVKVSTGHFVFPALYCNLKRANFLHYLPEDLVNYMVHITDLNRTRNQKIIEQAKELNELLVANNITPIFLKGTGNLLEGLYEDIAERMVGDIDFIVSMEEYRKTISLLKRNEYNEIEIGFPKFHRHYPSMGKENRIVAIEIHKDLLEDTYSPKYNYSHIKNDLIKVANFQLLGHIDQFHFNILVHQMNDSGWIYNTISLRKGYDIFLISKKIDIKNYLYNLNEFNNPINCFIAANNELFNSSVPFIKNKKTEKYVNNYMKLLNASNSYRKKNHKRTSLYLVFSSKIRIVIKSFYKKDYRNWLFEKIANKLGIKKENHYSTK
jgi:hypothetical protein